MSSIFTYAKAAQKMVNLLCRETCCRREKLTCDTRLESDLGVMGTDTYELLLAMETELKVDMSGFADDDMITPEGMTLGWTGIGMMLCLMLGGVAGALVVNSSFPHLSPPWLMLAGGCGAFLAGWVFLKCIPKQPPRPELRVRDLIRAVEAKRWVSPKVG